MSDLTGKVVLVTGGAQGIGYGVCRAARLQGANVVVIDRNNTALAEAETLLRKETGAGGVIGVAADVADSASMEAAFDSAKRDFGQLDCLVNNAGIIQMGSALESTAESWNEQLSVNVTGVHLCCKAFVQRLGKQHDNASIVNIASNAGKVGYPNMAAYNASKAAVISLTRTLSAEWAGLGVNVNAVCPGGVMTPMLSDVAASIAARTGENKDDLLSTMVPHQLGRHITPDEVAAVVLFLLSDAAEIIRGQSINIDGGDTPY